MRRESIRDFLRVYRRAAPDYIHADPEDDSPAGILKRCVAALPESERAVLVTYCELRSIRHLGEMLGLTKQTAWRMVCEIRLKILEEYDRLRKADD